MPAKKIVKKSAARPKSTAKRPAAKKAGAKKPAAKKTAVRKNLAAKKAASPAPRSPRAQKPVAKSAPKLVAAKKKTKATKTSAPRRDGTGHLDATYAADLRARSRAGKTGDGDSRAFLGRRAHSSDDLAEEQGEDFIEAATSGEDDREDSRDRVVAEESGGPFLTTSGGTEFASGTDKSNPRRATREPFPKT
jgi:hypothetical protein